MTLCKKRFEVGLVTRVDSLEGRGSSRLAGVVWEDKLEVVRMEAHHVRFEKAVSECDSETSWFSYASNGRQPRLILGVVVSMGLYTSADW